MLHTITPQQFRHLFDEDIPVTMTSEERTQATSGRRRDALSELIAILSSLYDVVSHENEKQKTHLVYLSRLHSNILEVQKYQRREEDVPASISVGDEESVSCAELEEAEKLLNRCREIKRKFQGCTPASREVTGSKLLQSKPLAAKREKHNSLARMKDKASPRSLCQGDKCTSNSTSSERNVISQRSLQQLNKLLGQREEANKKQEQPATTHHRNGVPDPSVHRLLEKNRALERKIRLRLKGEPPKASLLFLEKMDSSICQDCIPSHKNDMQLAKRDHNTDQRKVVTYNSIEDKEECLVHSRDKCFEFYCRVHHFVKVKILPSLEKWDGTEGVGASSTGFW